MENSRTRTARPEETLYENTPNQPVSSRILLARISAAICVGGMVSVYIYKILVGSIPTERKLGATDLVLLVVTFLFVTIAIRPRLLDRLTHFKFGNLEFELEKLQNAQRSQRNELNDLRFVLTLLLRASELQHLKKLQSGTAQNYPGNQSVRGDLRKLRTMGLVKNRSGHKVGEIQDGGTFDLSEFVELTDRGRDYLQRLGDEDENDG